MAGCKRCGQDAPPYRDGYCLRCYEEIEEGCLMGFYPPNQGGD